MTFICVPQTIFTNSTSANCNWGDIANWNEGRVANCHQAQVTFTGVLSAERTVTLDNVYEIENLTLANSNNSLVITNNVNSNYHKWNTPRDDKVMNLTLNGTSAAMKYQAKCLFPNDATLNIVSNSQFNLFGSGNSSTRNIVAKNLTINLLSGNITMDSINDTISGGTFNISGGALNYRFNSQALGNISNPMKIILDNQNGSSITFNNFTELNTIPNDFNLVNTRASSFNISIYGTGSINLTGKISSLNTLYGSLNFSGDTSNVSTRYFMISSNMNDIDMNSNYHLLSNNGGGLVVINTNSIVTNRKMRIGSDSNSTSKSCKLGFMARNGINIQNNIDVYVSNGSQPNTTSGYWVGCWDNSGSCTYSGKIILNPMNRTAQQEQLYLHSEGTSTSTFSEIISGSSNCNKVTLSVSGTGTVILNNLTCKSDMNILSGSTLNISGSFYNPTGTINCSGNLHIPSLITFNNLNCSSTSNIFINTNGSNFDSINVTNNITGDGYISFPDTSFNNGTYNIISYVGTLTNQGFEIGVNNTGKNISINVDEVNKKIQALVS